MPSARHRPFWLGTSWKMNKTLGEADDYARTLASYVRVSGGDFRYFVIPAFTALSSVARRLAGSGVLVGVQDVHHDVDGAHTGDVSASMAADAGALLAEIGHQERRRDHNETDALINAKVHRALSCGLRPLLCVGETRDDSRYGVASETVARQLMVAMHDVPAQRVAELLVAYEPESAIGSGATVAPSGHVARAHQEIREVLYRLYGHDSDDVPVLYGGSVSVENAAELATIPGVNGLFVGRAALEVGGLLAIAETVHAVLSTD